jgi:MGT family glycosyltransferase
MRVLLTALPDTGCLYSVLPIAEALKRQGHDVAFSSAASFQSSVETHNYPFLPAGLDWRTSDPRFLDIMLDRAGSSDLTRLTGPEPLAWLPWASEFLFQSAAQSMASDVIGLARNWHADIIVRDALEFGGCIAAETLGIPHASVATTADSVLDLQPIVEPQLKRLRSEFGLDPDPDISALYPYMHLSLTPPLFDGPDASYPSTTTFVRYASVIRSDESLPEWFDELSSAPLALVNLGMVFHRLPGLFRDIVEALSHDDINVVVATGSTDLSDALGDVSPNVHVTPWISYPLILPHCAVFITHGGMSSLREALKCGVPLVVLPVFADQIYSAHCCDRLGLGPVIMPHERHPEVIRSATRAALSEATYRIQSQAMRKAMQSLPEIDHAVGLLERLGERGGKTLTRS